MNLKENYERFFSKLVESETNNHNYDTEKVEIIREKYIELFDNYLMKWKKNLRMSLQKQIDDVNIVDELVEEITSDLSDIL